MTHLISFARLLPLLSLLAASPILAATFVVTNTEDAGAGSLRQAVHDANTAVGDNTVIFDLSGVANPVIVLTSDGIEVGSHVTILNDRIGDVPVTIRTETPKYFLFPCFYIFNSQNVLLAGLIMSGRPGATHDQVGGISNQYGSVTLRNCILTDNNSIEGGGVDNIGEMTLINCLITNNRAGEGGGLHNQGKMILQHCTVSGNTSDQGGGIENRSGDLTLIDCVVSDNLANDTLGGGGGGGGIINFGRLALTNCTVSGNRVAHFGAGGVHTQGGLTAIGCTFIGNQGESAGAIADEGSVERGSTLSNCTFSENFIIDPNGLSDSSALYANYQYINEGMPKIAVNNCTFSDFPGATGSYNGGAIVAVGQHLTVEMANNIFRRLSGSRTLYTYGGGTLTSRGHNLCSDDAFGDGGTGPGGLLAGPGDIRNTDPMLGPLADNGGLTRTFALLPGSAAIDAGDNATALPRDQRGYAPNGTRDIGAYEVGGATPMARLANISTRAKCDRFDKVLIAGFIVTGTQGKKVIVRAIGPSLAGASNLNNPTLELHDSSGLAIAFNDNWMDAPNRQEIIDSALAPANDLESAILVTLAPGAYTAVVRGVNLSTGIALAEVYDLDPNADSMLGNISTRGFVQTGDDVMIGGLIVLGPDSQHVLIRALGPALPVSNPLLDPELELRDGNGILLSYNNNWRDGQEGEILLTGIPPANNLEPAILRYLVPGTYTAIVRGVKDTTGVALIEAYGVN